VTFDVIFAIEHQRYRGTQYARIQLQAYTMDSNHQVAYAAMSEFQRHVRLPLQNALLCETYKKQARYSSCITGEPEGKATSVLYIVAINHYT